MAEHAPLLAEMAALAAAHADALAAPVRAFDIGGRPFDPDIHPELMGVVNLSRDSWYRESVVPSAAAAIRRGEVLAVQVTAQAVANRVQKVTDSETIGRVREAGVRVEVHGWRKNAKGRYIQRIVDLS